MHGMGCLVMAVVYRICVSYWWGSCVLVCGGAGASGCCRDGLKGDNEGPLG
jgi:hypothetical protein